MMITKLSLPRRTILRGMGTALALPLLDAMVPAATALAQTPANPTRRIGFVYAPIGAIQRLWFPTTFGSNYELSPSLAPIASVKDKVVVMSGLAHLQANSFGDGGGDHPRANAVFLTGEHAWGPGARRDLRLGTSADQYAAAEFGKITPLPSLEISLEAGTQLGCDTSDCFYSNTVSWKSPTTPNPMEQSPRVVFERLFGDVNNAQDRARLLQKRGSILDSVNGELSRLDKTLGAVDRSKLTEYTEAVREIERRIQLAESQSGERSLTLPERPGIDIPENLDDYSKIMWDLVVLAYRTDITRVFTYQIGREGSTLSYANIGVREGHHTTSHHNDNPDLVAKKAKIDTYHVQIFTYFLEKMRATEDGDGSLLDHSLILYGSGIGDGNTHSHTKLPAMLAGGAAGRLKGNRHINFPDQTPMSNVLMSMLDMVGVPLPEKIGDSTGKLPALAEL